MAVIKCPDCGKRLSMHAKKCTGCGAQVVVCGECGAVYPRGETVCNMCGRELGRKKDRARTKKRNKRDETAPNDLVSVINGVKQKAVGYKIVKGIRITVAIVFWIVLAVTAIVGLLFGGLLVELTAAVLTGSSIEAIADTAVGIVPRNAWLWWEFIKSILTQNGTAKSVIDFMNYIISASTLPVAVAAVYYVIIYIPLRITDDIVCGAYVRKRGYSNTDTVAVLECPSLVYNSADSFERAYRYFPFFEGCQGSLLAVVADILEYVTGGVCLSLGIITTAMHGVTETAIKVFVETFIGEGGRDIALTVLLIAALSFIIVTVAAIIIVKKLIVKAIRKKQLSYYSK